jgi:hypothetical protein
MNPTLGEIQGAINSTAKQVLAVAKGLRCWGGKDGATTYYQLIAKDKEVRRLGGGCLEARVKCRGMGWLGVGAGPGDCLAELWNVVMDCMSGASW